MEQLPFASAEFVIVGAGSAGCAMAYRLSQAGRSVIVIEEGGSDMGPFIQMPAALSYPMNMPRYDWGFQSEPEPHLGGRRLATPRGKVLGGSSSINGMVYVRGHAMDFDHWAESGATAWRYADVLPYFRRMESWHGNEHPKDRETAQERDVQPEHWRGNAGPLHISRGTRSNPLFDAFIQAGKQAGYPLSVDYNGEQQEGFGAMEATIHRGERFSAYKAYLRPALKGEKCRLIRGFAEKILFEGTQANGVCVRINGKSEKVMATNEVLLAASSINSPKLLMLSGIGNGEHLHKLGIPVIADRKGVGENLQDHLELYLQCACKLPITLYKHWNVFSKICIGLEWLLRKKGLGTSNHFESCAFIRSKAGVPYPDIQYHFLPIAVRYDGQASAEGHGFQAHVGPMRSDSRGWVRLASANPNDPPKILFNYMSSPKDWEDFRTCIKLTREIFSQNAFEPYFKREIMPGANVQEDAELDAFIRDNVESAYHPCGTCKMGDREDPMAVVDPEGRVIGVNNLRVVDSSVFPRIPNGNLNGPSIMVGEKMSDHVLGQKPLPPENNTPWQNPRWQTRQR